MTTATLSSNSVLQEESVRACIYYSVMICNSTGITYLIYLYTNGMVG